MDLGDRQVPSRQIIANVCSWLIKGGYRACTAATTGLPWRSRTTRRPVTPSRMCCGGRLSSCYLRFGQNNPIPLRRVPRGEAHPMKPATRDAIHAHALAEYPRESCGLIVVVKRQGALRADAGMSPRSRRTLRHAP